MIARVREWLEMHRWIRRRDPEPIIAVVAALNAAGTTRRTRRRARWFGRRFVGEDRRTGDRMLCREYQGRIYMIRLLSSVRDRQPRRSCSISEV